jgi:hypothetical protein
VEELRSLTCLLGRGSSTGADSVTKRPWWSGTTTSSTSSESGGAMARTFGGWPSDQLRRTTRDIFSTTTQNCRTIGNSYTLHYWLPQAAVHIGILHSSIHIHIHNRTLCTLFLHTALQIGTLVIKSPKLNLNTCFSAIYTNMVTKSIELLWSWLDSSSACWPVSRFHSCWAARARGGVECVENCGTLNTTHSSVISPL